MNVNGFGDNRRWVWAYRDSFVKVCAGGAGVRQMLSHDGNAKGCSSYRLLATSGGGEKCRLAFVISGIQSSSGLAFLQLLEGAATSFPEAKIILTKRDPDSWYESVMNTIWPASVKGRELARSNVNLDKVSQDRSSMVFEVIWHGIFDGRMSEKDFVIDKYDKNNQYYCFTNMFNTDEDILSEYNIKCIIQYTKYKI